ncbi:YciI family protein [Kitasatospora sp. NPDC101183]|uniref:YciI family protein n=1 Tax=Kitasatospora sp. NPDC101183 TaxID=3364100 RepID=UPI0038192FAA
MTFLIALHLNPAVMDALTEEERAALGAGHRRFVAAATASGELVTPHGLADPSRSVVVSVRGGQPVVTDGPFLEAKEYLGGFYLVECASLGRAVELAALIPDAAIDGLGVEVREVHTTAYPEA